jgi:hypothetical protein
MVDRKIKRARISLEIKLFQASKLGTKYNRQDFFYCNIFLNLQKELAARIKCISDVSGYSSLAFGKG